MHSDSDPEVRSRTMLIGTVVATIALLLLGLPWPIAVLAGLGGFFVSRVVGRKITPDEDAVATDDQYTEDAGDRDDADPGEPDDGNDSDLGDDGDDDQTADRDDGDGDQTADHDDRDDDQTADHDDGDDDRDDDDEEPHHQ